MEEEEILKEADSVVKEVLEVEKPLEGDHTEVAKLSVDVEEEDIESKDFIGVNTMSQYNKLAKKEQEKYGL